VTTHKVATIKMRLLHKVAATQALAISDRNQASIKVKIFRSSSTNDLNYFRTSERLKKLGLFLFPRQVPFVRPSTQKTTFLQQNLSQLMQMKPLTRLLILLIALPISGCDIYTSSDRKKFEEDQALAVNLQNKKLKSCSSQALSLSAESTREVSTYSNYDSSSVYILRQHLIHDTWVSEIDNLNGVFCIYE
jgi:hypothetical protein